MVTILLIIACFFLFIGIIILIAPFDAVLEIQYSDEKKMVAGSFSWLHPLIVCGEMNVAQQKVDMRIFHYFRIKLGSESPEDKDKRPTGETNIPLPSTDAQSQQSDASGTADQATASARAIHPSNDAYSTQKESFKQRPAQQSNRTFPGFCYAWERLKNLLEHPIIFFVRQKIWRQAMSRWFMLLARVPAKLWPDIFLQLHVAAHIQDPATTGEVYGYWMALSHAFSWHTSRRISVVFVPVFDREMLEIQGAVRIRTSLLRLHTPLLLVCLHFPFITTWRVWRASKKYNKSRRAEASNRSVTANS